MMLVDHAREVRRLLADPVKLCGALGLLDGAKKSAGGVTIRCPAHGDRTPSCSVTRGPDGTARVRCFACQWSGDAITLVGQVLGLDTRSAFREVLAEAARLGGDHQLAQEIAGGQPAPERPRVPIPAPPPQPEPEYPPTDEVRELWDTSLPVNEDTAATSYLVSRRIDPDAAVERRLLRVLHRQAHPSRIPAWATFKGQPWSRSGHRILMRTFDAQGELRGLRAWYVGKPPSVEIPKRLAPARRKSSGLVVANELAVKMLRRRLCPMRLVIVEGEPDFVVWSIRSDDAVIGVGSGWWTAEHARRVPSGTEVVIRTHHDRAGDAYAEQIARSLGDRCPLWRSEP